MKQPFDLCVIYKRRKMKKNKSMKFMKKQNCNIDFYNIAWPLI